MERLNIPIAYYQFDKTQPPASVPFGVWYVEGADNVVADNRVFSSVRNVRVELYDKLPNFELEEHAEALFGEFNLIYSKSNVYVEEEKMYMTIYEMEVL